ncbi:putative helicase [Gordonia hirsuta DSM 44140 = NBRC 16056]|uniref:Putative helicase n=1 Tax=Gordonia hirsuta DSM 44140 = NBRC 16056 TaxID=1121927 RepID=L7LEB0_9ACTN|nr:DEAD/DEAH box helicase [Gordonia hirsuta]GAC58393.1 putative helicase [Gordonia hirsuta DSM 44140 = NBRC 16056]
MHEGIFEELVTERVRQSLQETDLLASFGDVEKIDQPHVFARHVGNIVAQHLTALKDADDRIAVANRVIQLLDAPHENISRPPRQLLRLHRESAPGAHDRTSVRPTTPLSEVALLTNAGNGEPSIGHELPAEMASADSVDLVCAFIRWSGVRLLEPQLRELAATGKRLRVITTTYLGSTERQTLDRLVNDYGAEVMVQYDALRTRLHAKAWMFRRSSGFDTAYIGSSNLSNAALIDGVEWNVRLSRVATPSLLDRFQSTFDTYWNEDPSFEEYDPGRDRDRLDDALAEAAGKTSSTNLTVNLSGLEVRPYPFQQAMLEDIWAERAVHDRHWNLVVAATGTGKTVLAALDYRHLSREAGHTPRLLFVAHRREILTQALRTFREVLSDPNFGELYVDGHRPERWDHVFASVQSLTSYGVHNVPPDHFSVVIIDEFHHAQAGTYRRITEHLAPDELLGLTATPERADGVDVRQFFGGRIATELRLWDALAAELLCPFHYFGIADGTDLTQLTWRRGAYEAAELERLYTADDSRARVILHAVRDKLINPHQMRGLGFCVSVQHAKYMSDRFNAAGITADVVTGATPQGEREQSVAALRKGDVNILFSVDVFNEGLDIPEVDTILMLRPTESVTVFLQQLGRGLRTTPDKPVLTVLDFVGAQRDEFRWDLRLHAMTGRKRRDLETDTSNEFPFVPPGCRIVFDEQSQKSVLTNLKQQLRARWRDMVTDLRNTGGTSLRQYLEDTGFGLSDVLKPGSNRGSWTQLQRAAGIHAGDATELEQQLAKRMRAFAHVDDPIRVSVFNKLIGPHPIDYDELSPFEQTVARMLIFNLWPTGGSLASYAEGLTLVRNEALIPEEIASITDIAFADSRTATLPLPERLSEVPLRIHARYNREEILAALGEATLASPPSYFREGVKHLKHLDVDVLLVTLVKSEAGFSPSTMYRDYPISRTLFHWESQSTTSLDSPTGRRYVTGGSTVLLFARTHKTDDLGPMPFTFLGPATIVSHEGERPIAITWRLDNPMPAELFNEAKTASG